MGSISVNWTSRQMSGLMAVVAVAAIVYAAASLMHMAPPTESPLPWGDERSGSLIAEFEGETSGEGIYFLPEKSKVGDLLRAAAATDRSDYSSAVVNTDLAMGIKIFVDSGGDLRIGDMAAEKRLLFDLPVDINKVTFEELMLLPGIGAVRAGQIIELRRSHGGFKRIEELMQIKGIKEKQLSRLKKYLTLNVEEKYP